jgi:hypothetical protein
MNLRGYPLSLRGFSARSGSPGRIRTADQRINRVLGFTWNTREIAGFVSKTPGQNRSINVGKW